jgi:hypothetical protein
VALWRLFLLLLGVRVSKQTTPSFFLFFLDEFLFLVVLGFKDFDLCTVVFSAICVSFLDLLDDCLGQLVLMLGVLE